MFGFDGDDVFGFGEECLCSFFVGVVVVDDVKVVEDPDVDGFEWCFVSVEWT